MKKEDFPVMVFRGKRLLLVPELPKNPEEPGREHRCDMCLLDDRPCTDLNDQAFEEFGDEHMCGDTDRIYLPEENFQEYVVEFVRRRVG